MRAGKLHAQMHDKAAMSTSLQQTATNAQKNEQENETCQGIEATDQLFLLRLVS